MRLDSNLTAALYKSFTYLLTYLLTYLFDDPLLCGFNVAIKGLSLSLFSTVSFLVFLELVNSQHA